MTNKHYQTQSDFKKKKKECVNCRKPSVPMLIRTRTHMKRKKTVVILGDSMIKQVNRWDIKAKLKECKVFVKSFFCSEGRCFKNHVKLPVRKNPDYFTYLN